MPIGQGSVAAAAGPAPPAGQPFRELPRLRNEATKPGRFEAVLTAAESEVELAPGLPSRVLTYDGLTPGPLIEAREGDRVRIVLRNRIPGQASTIHWHGMPVPSDQDGNPMDPVASGGERVYEYTLPAGSAATYWYHPHTHELTAEQVYRGLAGVFVVKAADDPLPAAYGDTVLMLTDLRLAADGTMPPETPADLMNGRVGDHVLVNGRNRPVMKVPAGAVRRLRLCNACNARYLRLGFEGLAMTVVGSDGGLLAAPVPGVSDLLLAPAERAEVVVAFPAGGAVALRHLGYDRGWMGPGRPDDAGIEIMSFAVAGEGVAAPALPSRLRPLPPIGEPAARRRFVFGEQMSHGPDGVEMRFLINGKGFDMGRVDLVMRVGEPELWEIVNPTDMDHPFHVHGTQFRIVETERGGVVAAPAYDAWKDTVNLRQGETVRILLREDMPGPRMFHCHILEHEMLGMMGIAEVRA
jgi:bilirubin oxidase